MKRKKGIAFIFVNAALQLDTPESGQLMLLAGKKSLLSMNLQNGCNVPQNELS